MILVCEPVCWGGEHAPFNAGMLEIIRKGFPNEGVSFSGERTHIEGLQKQLGESTSSSIEWQPISIPERKAGYTKRFILEVRILLNLLRTLEQNPYRNLVFTSITPSALAALKVLRGIGGVMPNDLYIQAVLHSNVSCLNKRRPRHPIRRVQDMRTALTIFGRSNIQYLALEKGIRDAILESTPFLAGKVEVLEAPIPPNERESVAIELSQPIRFGFLGLANEQKGFSIFVKLATQVSRIYRNQAEFHAIGMFPNGKAPVKELDALAIKPCFERLSRKDFVERVKQLHFAIFPHRMEQYELTASGVLMDAIAWGKPIIARRIPIFHDLFNKYGEIGYLFDNDSELADITEGIIVEFNQIRYNSQKLNILKARSARMPGALARTYREISERAMRQRENGKIKMMSTT
ncbi:MAG TPA: glycosyltransferase [Thermodesulfobacteriota bacterium]